VQHDFTEQHRSAAVCNSFADPFRSVPYRWHNSLVRCGSLAKSMTRTPRAFRRGVRGCKLVHRPSQHLPTPRATPLRSSPGFCFWRLRDWTTLPARTAANGTCGLMGFSVMRSPVRCQSRLAEGPRGVAPLDRPHPMHRCHGSGKQRTQREPKEGLALLRPSTIHQEANHGIHGRSGAEVDPCLLQVG
jgi:hypothetical protein